jgi:hypothetical protein
MMKIKHIKLISAIIIIAIAATSCKDKNESSPSILGSWTMSDIDDQTIPYQLSLYANNFMEWVPLAPTENLRRESADYSFADGVLTITNDPNCPENAEYTVSLQGDALTLSVVTDNCPERIQLLDRNWRRKDQMLDVRLQVAWTRAATISDTLRHIIFYPQQNGVFEWLISNETPLYVTSIGRYAVSADYLVIYNFLDCHTIMGYYSYELQGGEKITISTVQDHCDFRTTAIEGAWDYVPSY